MSFFKGVSKELRKVKWLKKKEVVSQFIVVHVFAIVLLAYFGLIDMVINVIK